MCNEINLNRMLVKASVLKTRGLCLEKIVSFPLLNHAISFLEAGFLWSSAYSCRLESFLKRTSYGCGYGYALFDRKKLVGVILTIKQGAFFDEKCNAIPVINLSSWYVEPVYRGAIAIAMAESILVDLQGAIITDYTANPAAAALFSRFGLVAPQCTRFELFVWSRYIWNLSNIQRFFSLRFARDYSSYCFDFIPEEADGSKVIRLDVSGISLACKTGFVVYTRRICGLRFSVKVMHLHWVSDSTALNKLWLCFPLIAFFRYQALGVAFDVCPPSQSSEPSTSQMRWLSSRSSRSPFLLSADYYKKYGRVIPPVSSELELTRFL